MYRQCQPQQRQLSDATNFDLSVYDDQAQQDASDIPLEQLTKSEQVQPWNGQLQHGQISAISWQFAPSFRPGAMTEPIHLGRQAMMMKRTPSRNPSNADSGYVSQPVSAKPELDNSGIEDNFCPSSPYSSQIANDRPCAVGLRTVLPEGGDRLVIGRGSRKPSMTPCQHPGCGRLPKNHSDARKHAETHLKRFHCNAYGCTRQDGFATLNDLERHRKSVHSLKPVVGNPCGYICRACMQQSNGKETKFWPRRDNYKAHIRRKHLDWDETQLLEASKAHRPDNVVATDMETTSAISFVERQSEPSHVDHNERQFYQNQFVHDADDQQANLLSHQDDWHLFPGSDMPDDTLASMGGAMEGDTPYILQDPWSAELVSVCEEMPLELSYTPQQPQHYPSPYNMHKAQRLASNKVKSEAPCTVPYRMQTTQDSNIPTSSRQPSSSNRTHWNNDHRCPSCHKSHKRECDLKKHMKRHTRPYGCTFPHCSKKFGSRNDWKRHETSQHDFSMVAFKCGLHRLPSAGGQVCMRRPFHTAEALAHHLRSPEHGMRNDVEIGAACERFRIGGCDGKFWCGFCEAVTSPPQQHNDIQAACDFRIKHVGDHFDKDYRSVEDWICVEQNKAKKYITFDHGRYDATRGKDGEGCVDAGGEGHLPEWQSGMFDTALFDQRGYREQDAESVNDDETMLR